MADRTITPYAVEHGQLRRLLTERVLVSITGASTPEKAADYAVNALIDWPEGRALIARLARHLAESDGGDPPVTDQGAEARKGGGSDGV